MIAGAINTARITAVFGGLSFIFPPVTGILLGVAALVPVIGLVVTKIAAVNERKRFRKAMQACQDLPDQSPKGDVRAKLALHQSQKLRTFTRLVSEEACRSCEA